MNSHTYSPPYQITLLPDESIQDNGKAAAAITRFVAYRTKKQQFQILMFSGCSQMLATKATHPFSSFLGCQPRQSTQEWYLPPRRSPRQRHKGGQNPVASKVIFWLFFVPRTEMQRWPKDNASSLLSGTLISKTTIGIWTRCVQ